MEMVGATGGHVELQIEEIGPAFQALDERPRVQVLDRGDTNWTHDWSASKRPFRGTGTRPAAAMFRRISSRGDRRQP